MRCLIAEGKQKKWKYWSIARTERGTLVLAYGSIGTDNKIMNRITDMKCHEVTPDPHLTLYGELDRRTERKIIKGYEPAPPDIENMVENEMVRRGWDIDDPIIQKNSDASSHPEPQEESPQKQENWKPSEDFAWF
jgi:hypothetical protein